MLINIEMPLRWNDTDGYGHINNVAQMVLLENARVSAFWRDENSAPGCQPESAILAAGVSADTATYIARHEVEYLRPLEFRQQPICVQMWIAKLGGASIELQYRLLDSPSATEPYLQAASTLVMVNPTTGKPRKLTTEERYCWQKFIEAPLKFRRR